MFTPENIRAGVEQSLRRMRTDHLDLVQFHISPSRETLEDNGAVEALVALRDEKKTRFIGMSGTLPNLVDHIAMGVFDASRFRTRRSNSSTSMPSATLLQPEPGIIIRGGVARGAPAANADADAGYPEMFRQRYEQGRQHAELDDLLDGMSRMEFMLRFTLSNPDLDTTIVGTADLGHLADNVAAARKGPLPSDLYEEARRRLARVTAEE